MRKVVSLLVISSLTLIAFDGEKAYKQCAMCHGKKAEKVAVNSSPVLNTLSEEKLSSRLNEIVDGSTDMAKRFVSMHQAKLKGVSKEEIGLMSKYIINLRDKED
ncbi:MAG: c-type cytochrome [Campylobacterota bacterium]